MKNTRISALLPTTLVLEVKKMSKKENTTQSNIIKIALKQLLKKKLDKDTKELSKMKFDDLPSEDEWNLIQSAI